nr:hypothetical protein GCM10020185_59380 [Pseudomonas brassicacearum subsp. brassicacearum]
MYEFEAGDGNRSGDFDLPFFWGGQVGVYIRFFGNGDLWFRPDGGSRLKSPEAGPVKK